MRVVGERQLEAALAAVGGGEPRVVVGGNFATPRALLGIWDRAVPRYRLFMINAQGPLPGRDEVIFETPFVGPGMRDGGRRLDYLPMRLSLVPQLFARSRPPDVVLVQTSPPRSGKVSLGTEVNILVAAVEQTRARGGTIVAQLNPAMPYTFGDGELDVDLFDLAVELGEDLPSPSPPGPLDGVTASIGAHLGGMVADGATLQIGIGIIPDAALGTLGDRRGLAVWSEMVSDGVLDLERRGCTERERPIVTSFVFGSPELYAWADRNPRLRLARTETTNDPARIARQRLMTSINTALQVDLCAQANASEVRGRIYSGFGGQTDFIVGALHAPGGHAVIALRSWHAKSDSSNVVPLLPVPVTSFQHSAIVSEHGRADIFGRSQRAQARLITERVAHPDARAELAEAAGRLGLHPA